MSFSLRSVSAFLAASILLTATSFASSLPEGSFKGKSSLLKKGSNDVMALLIKKDTTEDVYHAVLAEYDRVPLTNITRKTALTKWVNRLYVYRVEKVADLRFLMKPLRVLENGSLEVNQDIKAELLTLAKEGTLDGAILNRYNKETDRVEESIQLNGRVGSTWETLVPGKFFGTTKKSGGDYFSKAINMELSKDGIAQFSQSEIKGQFKVSEVVPGLFTFVPTKDDNQGNDKVVSRIGVFIDIVNWKPLATTDELLLINPANASDVGFYYERH